MFVRLIFCKFSPGTVRQARKVYQEEIVPGVRRQRGNLAVKLLEPTSKSGDFISFTEWKTRADADAYESSGMYKRLESRLEPFLACEHELRTFHIEEIRVHADHL